MALARALQLFQLNLFHYRQGYTHTPREKVRTHTGDFRHGISLNLNIGTKNNLWILYSTHEVSVWINIKSLLLQKGPTFVPLSLHIPRVMGTQVQETCPASWKYSYWFSGFLYSIPAESCYTNAIFPPMPSRSILWEVFMVGQDKENNPLFSHNFCFLSLVLQPVKFPRPRP